MIRLHWLFLITLWLFSAAAALSQTHRLAGRVVDDATGLAVEHAIVKLAETGAAASTDSAGAFHFTHLAPGRYTLCIRHIAYADVERSVSLPASGTFVVAMPGVLLYSGEVIIRSTRTSSAIGSDPFPHAVVTARSTLLHAAVTAADALGATPGVSLVRDGPWATAVSIRGMSRSNIVMLVDDTRIETANDIAGALSLVDMQELDRVEVLTSPGSSLHGSGALGGVVHMVTKRPAFSDEPRASAEATEGITSVDRGTAHHLSLEHAGPIHALRLSGGYRSAGNTTTPAGILPNSQYTDFSLSGTLGLRTFGSHSLFIAYQRTQAEDTGIPGGAPIALSASARYLLARRDMLSLEYVLPNISALMPLLTVRGSRQSIRRNVEIIQSPDVTVTPHAIHDAASIQVEAKLAPMRKTVLTLGAEAWRRDLDSRREKTMAATGTVIGERPAPLSSYFSGGVYTHNEWLAAGERVTVSLGARYDVIRVSNDDAYNPDSWTSLAIFDRQAPERKLLWKQRTSNDHSWSANAGASVALTPWVRASCLAAAAYRAPSLEERFQFIDLGSIVRVGDPALRPEKSTSVNAGLRIRAVGSSMRTDVFLNSLADLVTEIPGVFETRPALVKANIGRARLYGCELSAEHALAPWAALAYSVSYVRGDDTRTHTHLPQIAPFNGRAAVTIAVPHAGTMELASCFAAAQRLTAAGEAGTPGYATADAGFSSERCVLGSASVSVRAGVRNIFDAAYRTHLSTLRGLIRLEPGRNVYLSLAVAV